MAEPNEPADAGSKAETRAADSPEVDPQYPFRFDCIDNAAYHAIRADLFDNIHRVLMATVLISSSATLAGLAGFEVLRPLAPWAGLIPLLASTADLVITPGSKAQTHTTLRARFFELLADIEEREATPEDTRRWTAALYRAYAQEPPVTYRVAKAVAYNVAVDTLWPEPEAAKRRLVVPWYHRVVGWLLPFHGRNYKPAGAV